MSPEGSREIKIDFGVQEKPLGKTAWYLTWFSAVFPGSVPKVAFLGDGKRRTSRHFGEP